MLPDDPRHGQRAGYIAGCRDACCRTPHLRYQKRSTLRRLREGSQYVPATRTLKRLEWWSRYGVTARAVALAAGISESTLQDALRTEGRVTRRTELSLAAVTWTDLHDSALVNAELTRWRIYSLMAAGHPLSWICDNVPGLNVGGKWRQQDRVTLGLARGVQHLFDTAPYWGTSRQTATKARARGYLVPLGWDDPGTPAAPHGWRPKQVPPTGLRGKNVAARIADLEHMIAADTTLDAACHQLGITRDALWKWATRHGQQHLYERLARLQRRHENQHTRSAKEGAA